MILEANASAETFESFQRIEKKHALITHIMLKISITMIVTAYGLSAMFPIWYSIFGYPVATDWRLPYRIQ